MQLHDIIILTLYACLTLTLIILKACKVGSRRRGVVKMITSVTFVVVGVFGCINHRGGLSIIVLVGLFFAMLGDLFLVFMDKRQWFIAGVLSFSGASLLLSVYSVWNFGWQWWSLLLFAALLIFGILCQKFNVYNYGKNKVYLNIYMTLVSACGTLGFTLFCQGVGNLPMFLFGLGCFLYLSSDICLGLYMFKFRNRTVDAINSALYFPAMLLIAVSMLV